ncbi:MAG: dihydropteroate synthase [Gammaproteobacteria bacterium]|nr:dihydropteroate synthase [Gammaproteobacteria bacterium]
MRKIILGLGSNLGDRLQYLRLALAAIKQFPECTVEKISPVYLSEAQTPDNAPDEWSLPFLNCAVLCRTTLSPEDILHHLKIAEKNIGRVQEKKWGPRVIDIDLLAYDDALIQTETLCVPHSHLLTRPFALWPLSDIAPNWLHPIKHKTAAQLSKPLGSRFSGEALFGTRQIAQRIDTPQLMGIVNVTPNSFSDGGQFHSAHEALQHIEHLIQTGAEIIDIGAEATNPKATKLDAETEWQRLEPILIALAQQKKNFLLPVKISIDTRHASVAERALDLDVDWINDVSGLEDPFMLKIIAEKNCDVVIMHHLGIPVNPAVTLPENENPTDIILKWAEQRIATLQAQGIPTENIIFDPGIGFGKTAQQSLQLIQEITRFQSLGTRMLVGHSRKRFLDIFTPKNFSERDLETAALSIQYLRQVDYLRVHQTETHARLFKIFSSSS